MGGGHRGAECHPWQGKICQNREKEGKSGKIGEKRKNWEKKAKIRKVLSITLPLLTDRAGYATEIKLQMLCFNLYT